MALFSDCLWSLGLVHTLAPQSAGAEATAGRIEQRV